MAVAAGKSLYTANMSSGVSVDEFQALEQKVLRAVEIVKREREARSAAEAEIATLREQLAAQAETSQSRLQAAESRAQAAEREKETAESQIAALNQDRDVVRQRVEKMLQQMDELL
jgi:chromosome segregation ATPase